MQTSLREKVAEALGWTDIGFLDDEGDTPTGCPPNPRTFINSVNQVVTMHDPLPDPEDISVVWRLRELAIEKDCERWRHSLTHAVYEREDDDGTSAYLFNAVVLATKEQTRTAALSVVHGVSVEEVREWS